MEDEKFRINLASMNEVFNNKTLRYRINGFAYACNMQNIGIMRDSGVLFDTNGFNSKNESGYFISTSKSDNPLGKSVTISGQYNDLFFIFTNYYKNENLDKRIIDLPFLISLSKKDEKSSYNLDIETIDKARTKITIYKLWEADCLFYDDVSFYVNINDFSKVLKLVKSFVLNPVLVFNTYDDMRKQYKMVYKSSDLNKAIIDDENLDKPMGKIKKIVKRISNND